MTKFQQLVSKVATFVSVLSVLMIPSLSLFAGPTTDTVDGAPTSQNLARMRDGAKIECMRSSRAGSAVVNAIDENKRAAALIMDDETLGCPLPEGETTFVISLAKSSTLSRIKFLNQNANARGRLKIAVSNYRLPIESRKWVEVDGPISFTEKPVFDLSLVGVEARYVKLSFNVEKSGRIASLGLFGSEWSRDLAQVRDGRKQSANRLGRRDGRPLSLADRLNFNYANLNANAHVVYVSSGSAQAADSMIGEDRETGFGFAPNDRLPTAVVELGETVRLNRVSARYDAGPARLDVYLLDKFDRDLLDRNLAATKPVASVGNANATGRATVDFDPQDAHFVVFRWTATAAGSEPSLEVAEIDAFGEMPLAMLDLNEAPDVYASSSSSVTTRPGESHTDLSSALGPLAIPPVLPTVSP